MEPSFEKSCIRYCTDGCGDDSAGSDDDDDSDDSIIVMMKCGANDCTSADAESQIQHVLSFWPNQLCHPCS